MLHEVSRDSLSRSVVFPESTVSFCCIDELGQAGRMRQSHSKSWNRCKQAQAKPQKKHPVLNRDGRQSLPRSNRLLGTARW